VLNHASPIPLYFQLYRIIKEKIISLDYPEGEKIPSENTLSESYKIGRPTVRQAIECLIRDGLLEKRRGSGTYVKPKRKEVGLFSLAGTSAAFAEKGIVFEQKIIDNPRIVNVPDGEANPFSGERAYFFSRLSLVKNEPILLELIYLDSELFRGFEKYEIKGKSLAHVIEEYFFMKPSGGKQSFSILPVPDKYAVAFGANRAEPLLFVRRTLNFKQKENGIYSEIFCRTDRFEFSQDLSLIS
jgi:GntR family transcriptional regulator